MAERPAAVLETLAGLHRTLCKSRVRFCISASHTREDLDERVSPIRFDAQTARCRLMPAGHDSDARIKHVMPCWLQACVPVMRRTVMHSE
jgi:hypothetical protein